MISFIEMAQILERDCGVPIIEDGDDLAFICPYCEEYILSNDHYGHDFTICPVCEEILSEEEEHCWDERRTPNMFELNP